MTDATRIPGWARAIWGIATVALIVLTIGLFAVIILPMQRVLGEMSPSTTLPLILAFGGVYALLSYGLLILSIVHVVWWSGMTRERKWLWAVILLVAGQPGFFIYWWANIRTSSSLEVVEPENAASTFWRHKTRLVGLAILSVLPLAVIWGAPVVSLLPVQPALPAGTGIGLVFGTLLLYWALTAVYLVDAYWNSGLEDAQRAPWAAAVGFLGPLGWMPYWYVNMWRKLPVEPPA